MAVTNGIVPQLEAEIERLRQELEQVKSDLLLRELMMDAELAGMSAYIDGKPESDNPYPMPIGEPGKTIDGDSPGYLAFATHEMWNSGWWEMKRESEGSAERERLRQEIAGMSELLIQHQCTSDYDMGYIAGTESMEIKMTRLRTALDGYQRAMPLIMAGRRFNAWA